MRNEPRQTNPPSLTVPRALGSHRHDASAHAGELIFESVPVEYGAVLRMLTETIASGHGSRPNSDVEKATGVAPTSFADFARRTAAAWAVDEFR